MNPTARLLRVLALTAAPLFMALPAPAAAHSRAELEQMLAPIALYPDSVLSHVLIAATYPGDVEEAARWSRRNPDLHGEDAVNAVDRHDWDPSVKALVAFPEILARMDEEPDWTDDLGDAFLEHEAEVMDSVQTLRDHAYDRGHLRTTEHVRVIREREYIYIEPALHHVVYVPYYDPWYVYGSWWWPSHPPYRWRHWHGHAVSYYGTGFYWGVGFRIAPSFYFTSFYWPERYVVVTQYRAPNYRPLYSGRHVTRQQEVRHWRGERPAGDTRQPRADRDRGASSRPDSHPGRGGETRRPRDDNRDEGRGNRGSRVAPDRDGRKDEAGTPRRVDRETRENRRPERETRKPERATGREEAPGTSRREDRVRTDAAPAARPERSDRQERRREAPAERPSPRAEQAPPPARERGEERRNESRGDDGGNGREERGSRGRDEAPARGKRDERKDKNGERSQRDR
jgi:hypothetical protein